MSGFPRPSAATRAARGLPVVAGVVAGAIVGAVAAFVTGLVLIASEVHAMQAQVNGWSSTMACGEASDGILRRAACAEALPMVNLPAESVYWTATVDGAGQTLTGQHDYIMQFPPGGLPPNGAFWSLTITNTLGHLVANPSNVYSVGDRSGLAPNPDGSTDIYIQQTAPPGETANWLPAPSGAFKLWLRVYQPGAAILRGAYRVPAVQEVH